MIEIDLKKLKSNISSYSELIESAEKNNTEIIHNFTELDNYWQDFRKNKLNASVNSEERDFLNLEKNLKQQLEIYKEIEQEYSKIGKNIKCNLNGQNTIDLRLNAIINKINNIITAYNNLGDISFYHRAYLIYNQKEKMQELLESFKQIRKNINNTFDEIKKIEAFVEKESKSIKIQNMLVNNYESEE